MLIGALQLALLGDRLAAPLGNAEGVSSVGVAIDKRALG
jgi:hypothetical protein